MTTTENSNEPDFKYRIQAVRYHLLHGIKRRYILFDDRETDYKERSEDWNKEKFEYWSEYFAPGSADPASQFKDVSLYHKRTCPVCGFVFYPDNGNKRYCSQRCMNDAYMQRRKQRLERNRLKYCHVCKTMFQAKRKDTVYCSASCKQQAYRTRTSEKEQHRIELEKMFHENRMDNLGGGDL